MPSSQGRIIILTIFCSMHEEPTGPYKLPLLKRPFVWDDVATSDLTLISTIWAWLILWFWMNIQSNQSTLFLHPLWSDPQQPHNLFLFLSSLEITKIMRNKLKHLIEQGKMNSLSHQLDHTTPSEQNVIQLPSLWIQCWALYFRHIVSTLYLEFATGFKLRVLSLLAVQVSGCHIL